jgi:peptidoglycan/LPS O-acetylase OafA/YrhL
LIINSSPPPVTLEDIPAQFFALQFNHDYVLSGVFWTLGIEVQFYIIAPFLVMPILTVSEKSLKIRLIVMCFIYLVMVSYIYYAVHFLGWSYDGRNLLANLPHFFVGMAACLITSKFKPNKLRFKVSILSAVILFLYTNWLYSNFQGKYWSISGMVKVDLMIFMFILAHASLSRDRFKSSKLYMPFAMLGTLSYGIYAWHAYLMKYLPELSNKPLLLIPISAGIAYLSYRVIESPALILKREKNHSPIESVIK